MRGSELPSATAARPDSPDRTYAVVEVGDAVGGTWDLFRYPGVRSDSDMFTLGYSSRPWSSTTGIADGPSILQYVRDTAAESGVDRTIRGCRPRRRTSSCVGRTCW